jgi:intracellular multiplication protein IcmC
MIVKKCTFRFLLSAFLLLVVVNAYAFDPTTLAGGAGGSLLSGVLGSGESESKSGIFDSSSILSMFQNLNTSLPGVTTFLIGLCYLMGLTFTISAIWRLKKFGHRTAFMHVETGLIGPIILFLMGVALLYTPGLFQIINMTLFGTADFQNILEWESQQAGVGWAQVIYPMLQLIQVIGLVSFLRGWLLLSRATNTQTQPGTVSKGLIHLVAGVLAMNVTRTIDLVTKSLGLLS